MILPSNILRMIPVNDTKPDSDRDLIQLHERLREGLKSIVKSAALFQNIKGLISAGPLRSLRYVASKLGKGFLS